MYEKNGVCRKKNDGVLNCPHCYTVFAREWNLKMHLQARALRGDSCSDVKSGPVSSKHLTCTICAAEFSSYSKYVEHAVADHEFAGTVETTTHPSQVHYNEWFEDVMKKNQFSWVLVPGSKKTDKVTHFMCSRSGVYKQRGEEKRNRAKKSTRKLDAECTCHLTVHNVSASEIVVHYCLDHLGHSVDVCHLPKDHVMKVSECSRVLP